MEKFCFLVNSNLLDKIWSLEELENGIYPGQNYKGKNLKILHIKGTEFTKYITWL